MSITAEEIVRDWDRFIDDWNTHAEEHGYPRYDPKDVQQPSLEVYLDFVNEYPFDHEETPDFVEAFNYEGYSALQGMARRDVQFLTEKEWKEERDQELEDATEEWVWPYLKREEFLDDSRADWDVEDVAGELYYYKDY